MTSRRELQLAVLLCLLGSAVVLLAGSQTWVTLQDNQQLTIAAVRSSVPGSTLVPAALALGYVGLAGVVALAATKRWGRTVVGVLVLVAGVGVVVVVARALQDGIAAAALEEACDGTCGVASRVAWAWLTLAGGVLLAVSGALVTVRGRRWAALSSSYAPPASRAQQPPATDKGVWDALDRGEDPTT